MLGRSRCSTVVNRGGAGLKAGSSRRDMCVIRDWLPGRPLTDFRRRRRNLPLPLERVKRGGLGGRCSTSAWLVHRGSHPHPSPLPQGRGSKSGVTQEEIDPGPSRVVTGLGAQKTAHRFPAKTPEPRIESPGSSPGQAGAGSPSPPGEGEAGRPRRKVLNFGLAASLRQPPSPQPSPSRRPLHNPRWLPGRPSPQPSPRGDLCVTRG